jgi:hypothetical protein
MIVRMGWLEQFSPIKIHWAQKWLSILYEGNYITLQGIRPDNSDCKFGELMYKYADSKANMTDEILVVIQQLLHQFESVFPPHQGYPWESL